MTAKFVLSAALGFPLAVRYVFPRFGPKSPVPIAVLPLFLLTFTRQEKMFWSSYSGNFSSPAEPVEAFVGTAGHPDLPVVISDAQVFMTLSHYAFPAWASRFVSVVDAPEAVACFGRWVPPEGAVLDLGAGYCEFINNVNPGMKYAMDLNPEILKRAGSKVKIFQQDCSEPWPLAQSELDAVFTSNFLEHLRNKEALLKTLSNAHYCLKPGGGFIAMGPNIKYAPGAYWDFFDHYVELTELSLAEALLNCGFGIETQVGRFLPYTMSQGRQYPSWILRLYLALPAAWPLFGKQFLVIGRKSASSTDAVPPIQTTPSDLPPNPPAR